MNWDVHPSADSDSLWQRPTDFTSPLPAIPQPKKKKPTACSTCICSRSKIS
jgi:hypothetical protein